MHTVGPPIIKLVFNKNLYASKKLGVPKVSLFRVKFHRSKRQMANRQSFSSGGILYDQLGRSALNKQKAKNKLLKKPGSPLTLFTVSVPQRRTLVTWLSVRLAVSGPIVSVLDYPLLLLPHTPPSALFV